MTPKQPDAEEYATKKQRLKALVCLAALGYIDLRFADETGFSMVSNVPYGWLPVGQQTGIMSSKRHLMNVFGLMSLKQELVTYSCYQSINASFIERCLDDFAKTITKPTVVVLDQASWHTAKRIEQKRSQWEASNLFLFFLPPYSPHLNAIEILWRQIKYRWLKPKDYLSPQTLKQAIFNIFRNFGSAQFAINFSMNF